MKIIAQQTDDDATVSLYDNTVDYSVIGQAGDGTKWLVGEGTLGECLMLMQQFWFDEWEGAASETEEVVDIIRRRVKNVPV